MDNYAISDQFSLLSKLMDIHGDNSFRAKSYASAAYTIEKLPAPLSSLPPAQIASIKGIGDATASKILEILQTGRMQTLETYLAKTPAGILEMMQIKGLGPKKIATIWKEMEMESLGELLYACNENRLMLYKGFGEKTQQNIKEAIEFYMGTQGSYLYQQVEAYALGMTDQLRKQFPNAQFALTGAYRRQLEVIDQLDWLTTTPLASIEAFYTGIAYEVVESAATKIILKGPENIRLCFYYASVEDWAKELFITTASAEFLDHWNKTFPAWAASNYADETAIFDAASISYIAPALRETAAIIDRAKAGKLPQLIQPNDIRGIVHSHSKWSDGVHSIKEMAHAAIAAGLEYLVISDHSKTAAYANGLQIERVLAQHEEIEHLNKQYTGFRIFKSIESDILGDGSLDYPTEILAQFDLVIASVHSNLKMAEEKAMQRLLAAIENPYTNILGHMTGRLLLSRNGYPLDHYKIIDACAANQVVIELNAHPRRLDIDWRWIDYALSKNVLISIDPDAHAIEGYADCKYGVLVAQKAGLSKEQNLSSFTLDAFTAFIAKQNQKRP
ncbi:MAG TPA: histidinol-phosphatase [Chitinophagaceae bacterium]|nr:histidinol-phosphatase [Chitinophagaceae bacterium]